MLFGILFGLVLVPNLTADLLHRSVSINSFDSYVSNIHQFFHPQNDLANVIVSSYKQIGNRISFNHQFLYNVLGQYGVKFLHAEHTNYQNLGVLDVYLIITNKKRRLVPVYIWVFLSLQRRHDYPNKKFPTQSKKNKKARQRVGPHVCKFMMILISISKRMF